MRDFLATVTRSLQNDVLPHVDAGWVAGNLRACISVLTHLESRAGQERSTLLADSADMRLLLAKAVAQGIDPDGGAATLLAAVPEREDVPDAQLRSENAAHRERLTALIAALTARRGDAAADALRGELHACIRQMQAREYEMFRAAEALPPI